MFYPTALKGCLVLFSPISKGGGVCPGCISETARRRKLILGREIGWAV